MKGYTLSISNYYIGEVTSLLSEEKVDYVRLTRAYKLGATEVIFISAAILNIIDVLYRWYKDKTKEDADSLDNKDIDIRMKGRGDIEISFSEHTSAKIKVLLKEQEHIEIEVDKIWK